MVLKLPEFFTLLLFLGGCHNRPPAHTDPYIDAAGYHRSSLALPSGSFRMDDGGYNNPFTRKTFLREYKWIRELLERTYPGHEFLFIPEKLHKQVPEGWTEVEFRWRGHIIYRRPISGHRLLLEQAA